MKKRLVMIIAVVSIIVVAVVGMVGCNPSNVKALPSQIEALLSVKSGQSDIAIIDSTMAGYLINLKDGSYQDLTIVKISDLDMDSEEYGVAAKKGNLALIDMVNKKLVEMQTNGTFAEIAQSYGLTDRVVNMKYESNNATDDSWNNILTKKEIVIAYTINPPMGIEENNTVKGFDIDLARAIFEPLGVTVITQLIEWGSKEFELDSNKVDLVWNGLTITDERKENMAISIPYLTNEQAIVVKKENKDSYKTKSDIVDLKIAIENGSAAESVVKALGLKI